MQKHLQDPWIKMAKRADREDASPFPASPWRPISRKATDLCYQRRDFPSSTCWDPLQGFPWLCCLLHSKDPAFLPPPSLFALAPTMLSLLFLKQRAGTRIKLGMVSSVKDQRFLLVKKRQLSFARLGLAEEMDQREIQAEPGGDVKIFPLQLFTFSSRSRNRV